MRETLADPADLGDLRVLRARWRNIIPADFTGPVVMDFVDVDSAKFEAYARAGKGQRCG